MQYKQLQDAGLNENEAKIYLASLEMGQTSASRIAKKAGIKRTTVYLSLENLMQKGLMSTIKKDGKSLYFAEDPRNLERIMTEKKERISEMIPELLAFTNLIDRKPEIRYFEGEEGIKEVLKNGLDKAEREICVMYSETYISDFDENFFSEYYIPERIKRKIFTRALLPDTEQMRETSRNDEAFFKKSRFMPSDLFKIKMEVMVYGRDATSIISFKEKFALIIESSDIHDSFKSIFETMWASGK